MSDPRAKVDADLKAIEKMVESLEDEAVHKASHRLMPGGAAMVALHPGANLEAWENRNQATERYSKAYTMADLEDPEKSWPPFQLLRFWSEQWRVQRGADYLDRPTITTEANWLRYALEWAWEDPGFEGFAKDVRSARLKLEDILTDGTRAERSRIVCDQCDANKRLILAYAGTADDRSDDVWKCPACKHRFNPDGVKRAHAKMLRSEGAERWVHQIDAIGVLRGQGRSERTVRQWLAEGEGEGYCDPQTHEVWVWWPNLWRRHLMTPTRNRSRPEKVGS